MDPLLLDVRTLAFVSGFGGIIMAATMVSLYLAGTRQSGVRYWMAAGLCFALGYLSGHLLLTLPTEVPPWLAAALANTLIGMAHTFILLGVQKYLGVRPWTWPLLGLVAAMFLALVFMPVLRDSLQMRIISQSSWYVLMNVAAGVLLWRAPRPGLTAYRRAVAVVLLAFAAFLLVRLGSAAATPGLDASFVQSPVQILAFLVGMLVTFVLTMALVVLLFREKELHLQYLARHDALTGLYNRHSLSELAPIQFSQAERYGTSLSLIAIDLDHFKPINDEFGHLTGDRMLRGIGKLLSQASRESDLVFRTGGEEFLLLLPCTTRDEAKTTAQRIRGEIAKRRWALDERSLSVTASLGVVEVFPDIETWEDAVRRVDRALYEAKREGRNRVRVADAR